ncbi:VOC family protein [Bradyrhizobium sp. WYCCWR 13022]|uniref:VOC family protein n=1 Tax=unclassified Bradyrhizobium TaxID=2631580 RepID=UPI00263A48FA|nr:VOC family protein [Bradyrhizobium sp. WYCCWR 13022]MDN4984308.1 VOC family protein [Bradyrhizobium sp. WYCCWR 13022]
MTDEKTGQPPEKPVMPSGMNHLVLNVYDIEETHRFWTEVIGLKQVGALAPGAGPNGRQRPKMRFYSGYDEGARRHHDIAFVENASLPPKPKEGWDIYTSPNSINHIAIELPSREAWLQQLEFMQSKGVKFNRKIDHGMSHSVYVSDPNGYGVELLYELPRENWENDLNAAFNYARERPAEGPEALRDDGEVPKFG